MNEPFLEASQPSFRFRGCLNGRPSWWNPTFLFCAPALMLVACYMGTIVWSVQSRNSQDFDEPLDYAEDLEISGCTQDTGGTCYLWGCDDWRNAECIEGSCTCRSDQCAVSGQCLPQSWAKKPAENVSKTSKSSGFASHPVKGRGNFTALVLSGGGAKGAFELGVLEGICKNASLEHLRNWSMIVGTSIGALNAGALAQFSPEAQCSQALLAAQSFWDSIKAPEDVWVSSDMADPSSPDPRRVREPCMTPGSMMSMALSFWQRGGLCDPAPGRNAFEFAVQKDRIRTSGMMLRVVATSLKTGQAKWWDEKSEKIIQGCEASGAIAPIIYPMEVDNEAFVDGGFVANTPIMKALQDGAQTVLVVNLDPLATGGLIPDLRALQQGEANVGLSIMQSEFSIMQQRYFLEHELQMACWGFPDRKILAYTPLKDPGNFMAFSGAALQRMRQEGVQTVNETEPVDLCKTFFKYQHHSKEPREMRAALAKHPAPVMIGHPKELMADASPTPTPPPWGDHRFALFCFFLGLLAGLSIKHSCMRVPHEDPIEALDV